MMRCALVSMCDSEAFVIFALCLIVSSGAQVSIQLSREEFPLETADIEPKGSVKLLGTGKVPQIVKNFKNVYYYGYIRIGTPGDLVRVIFDTGSPSFWVYSGSGWKSWFCMTCWFHKTYRHARSSTYVPDGRPMEISYISGYMKGYFSQDVLSIGNIRARVYLAEATSVPFLDTFGTKYDGILGLAPCSGPDCAVYRDLTPSVVNPILSQLAKPVFAFYLDRHDTGYGEIMFGGTNPQLYKEETLTMHRTTSPYMWSLRIDSVWVGDELVLNYTTGVDAFIDTGTSLIVGPPSDVYKVLTAMNIDMGLEVACKRANFLPPITFVIEGNKYTLNSQQYASTSTKPIWGSKICYNGLQAIHVGNGGWVLGDLFLSNFYTVFEVSDRSTAKIGFAQLKNERKQGLEK